MGATGDGPLEVSVRDRVSALFDWTSPITELAGDGYDRAQRSRMRRVYGIRLRSADAHLPPAIVAAVSPVVGPEWGRVLTLALERRRPTESEWIALEGVHPPVELLVWAVNRACASHDPGRARIIDALRRHADPWTLAVLELEEHRHAGDPLHVASLAKKLARLPEATGMRGVLVDYAGHLHLSYGDPSVGVACLLEADGLDGHALSAMTNAAIARELVRQGQDTEAAKLFARVPDLLGTGGDEFEGWAAAAARVLAVALASPGALRSQDVRRELDRVLDPLPWPAFAFLWAALNAAEVGREHALAELDREADALWIRLGPKACRELAMEVGVFLLEERDGTRGRAWCRRAAAACGPGELEWFSSFQVIERIEGRKAAEAFAAELRRIAGATE